jgi:hypothetical protein
LLAIADALAFDAGLHVADQRLIEATAHVKRLTVSPSTAILKRPASIKSGRAPSWKPSPQANECQGLGEGPCAPLASAPVKGKKESPAVSRRASVSLVSKP